MCSARGVKGSGSALARTRPGWGRVAVGGCCLCCRAEGRSPSADTERAGFLPL